MRFYLISYGRRCCRETMLTAHQRVKPVLTSLLCFSARQRGSTSVCRQTTAWRPLTTNDVISGLHNEERHRVEGEYVEIFNTTQLLFSKCRYNCTRNVLRCRGQSSHMRANYKTLNYNNSKPPVPNKPYGFCGR